MLEVVYDDIEVYDLLFPVWSVLECERSRGHCTAIKV